MNFYSGKATIPWRSGRLLTACLLGTGFLAAGVSAQAVPEAPVEDTPAAGQIVSEAPPQIDSAAAAYATKCMGCHTIGGGVLTGPDLKNSASYPRQTVIDAVKRMEKNVGPLSEADVTLFTDFLLAANAAERLAAHREQVQMREAASMAPPDARQGEALFFGHTAFSNGGVSCAACHQAGGRGGNLAASLEDAYTRLGAQPLQATAETPGFPVMRAIYTPRPVTRQEALHLVKYLEEVSADPAPPSNVSLHVAGIGGTVLVLVLLGKSTRRRVAGTRARLVADASRRNDRAGNRGRTH